MLGKKCSKCSKKIKKDYEFCPFCGHNLKSQFDKDDYGLLGKNDSVEMREPSFMEGLGLGGLPINKIIGKAMKELPSVIKMLEKQLDSSIKSVNNENNRLKVQFFVNGKKVNPNSEKSIENKNVKKPFKEISKEKIKMLTKFPKVEPKSEVRRLSGRVIYNIHVPEVKDIEDVFINQLESSIEIKAIGKDKVYSKTLNLNLPLKGYDLINGSLVVELGGE